MPQFRDWGECFSKYATFSGRATRSEYWYFALFVVVGKIAATRLYHPYPHRRPIISLVLLPWLAVFVRRLHDIDRTARWALLISMPRPWDDALLILAGFQCKRVTYISSDTDVPPFEGGSAAADPTNEWRGIARCRDSSAPLASVRRKESRGLVR